MQPGNGRGSTGSTDNPDPSYPHPGGALGAWGYGILDDQLRSPGDADIMTYCDPSWPSDYGWTMAYERMQALAELPASGTLPVRVVTLPSYPSAP